MTREDAEIVIPAIVGAILPIIRQEVSQALPRSAQLPEVQLRQLVDAVYERLLAVHLAKFVRQDEVTEFRRQLGEVEHQVTELRKGSTSQPDGLPVGGERVVKHLLDANPDLTRDEAVEKARQAFQATASVSPDEAIAWLDESLADEILPADETELDETISQLLGYESFHRAPRRQYREIRQLASVFSQREDSRRTLDELQAAIGEAVEAGQLSPKKS